MKRLMIVWLVLLWGCATTEDVGQSLTRPELVSLTPLPPRRAPRIEQGLKLDVVMHVTKEGTVDEAQFRGSSGDPTWDSLAVEAIKNWKFVSARRNGIPVDVWIRQQVTVEFQEPVYMVLSELICSNLREADSVLALLREGADFLLLAKQSGGRLLGGEPGLQQGIDLAVFPPAVSTELRRLREGDMTRPIRVGDKYIIYMRVKKGTVLPSAAMGTELLG